MNRCFRSCQEPNTFAKKTSQGPLGHFEVECALDRSGEGMRVARFVIAFGLMQIQVKGLAKDPDSESRKPPGICDILVAGHYTGPWIAGSPGVNHLRVIQMLQGLQGIDERILKKISYTPQLHPVVLEFPQFLMESHADLVQGRLRLQHRLEPARMENGFERWAPSVWIESVDGNDHINLGMSLRPSVADDFYRRISRARISLDRLDIDFINSVEDAIHISIPKLDPKKAVQLLRLFFSR